jgi:hypothetical protein
MIHKKSSSIVVDFDNKHFGSFIVDLFEFVFDSDGYLKHPTF